MENLYFCKTIRADACVSLRNMLSAQSFRITAAVLYELHYGLQDLWDLGETETIVTDCANIYRGFGFDVIPHGVGWHIS